MVCHVALGVEERAAGGTWNYRGGAVAARVADSEEDSARPVSAQSLTFSRILMERAWGERMASGQVTAAAGDRPGVS